MKDIGHMTGILYRALLSCKTEEDCAALLGDLCTYQEIEQMAQRAASAKLILEGKITEQTGISSATLSRVSKEVRHGRGGYAKFLPKN